MKKTKTTLGKAELEVLRYVQDNAPVTVREVARHFAASASLARTTILTVMDRLRAKGQLTRKKVGGVYRYSPVASQGELMRSLVKDFVDTTLGGTVSPFLAYLVEQEGELSPDELQELKRLVRKLDVASESDEGRGKDDKR
jgi:predicted transcriptional regulator